MLEMLLMFIFSVCGPVAGLIITGILLDRFVLRKVIRNREVQETLEIFREARDLLKQFIEEEKRKRQG